jgi:hypothetical protein
MHFVALCADKPDALHIRLDTRPRHVEWLAAHSAQVKVAGPFLDAQDQMIGSMLILDCVNEKEARALLASDPYAHAGLFASVELRPWRWVIGEPKS